MRVFGVLAFLVSVAACAPPPVQPPGWGLYRDPVDPLRVIQWRVDLVQRNKGMIVETLKQVSDPTSPKYGQYLTNDDLREMIGQPAEALSSVQSWLVSNPNCPNDDVTSAPTPHYDYVSVTATSRWLMCFFNTWTREFRHNNGMRAYVGTPMADKTDLKAFGVPEHLEGIIERIVGVRNLPVAMRRLGSRSSKQPGLEVDPPMIRTLYEADQYKPISGNKPQAWQACAEFQEEYWYPSDILTFQAHYDLPADNVSTVIGLDDPDSEYAALGEATLDFEYITTIQPMVTWAFSLQQLDYIAWANEVTSTHNSPLVHSISYGTEESDYTSDDLDRNNQEFAKMGTQGYTILVASGDDGPGYTKKCKTFNPTYPGISPYTTSVGGTYLGNDGQTQTGWADSGGGFSNLMDQAWYQSDAVNGYLNSGVKLPKSSMFNPNGTAGPDIGALATNYQVCIENYFDGTPISGTSAASPVFASLFTYVNAMRLQKGKAPLGFLNPAIYQAADVGTDITAGKNEVSKCSNDGYLAAKGWDPVTGFGTPKLSTLINNFL